MSYNHILFEKANGVAKITFNEPDSLNALSSGILNDLADAINVIDNDDEIRAIILTGSGRSFSAGANLVEMQSGTADLHDIDIIKGLDENYNPLIRKMRKMEKPIICAVNGIAAGAGMSFALVGDIILAARSASFTQVFTRIGLMPDAGSTFFLPQKVGIARAIGLALTGDTIPAQQAADWGMIWKCVEDDKLMDEATTLAERLAQGPTRAYGMIKRSMAAALNNSLDEQLDLETGFQGLLGKTKDFKEGVTAFIEKRPASFKGK
ncbi:MAG: enoyl-CoA hydratase-related protein [Alphaproteobacteria bacterium]|nr:enoyl-CoA hydratase-related protein [Rhodospirillales bacterium]MCW9045765.1 enoyl-CoA hydratase-related protein [Alphaproteobacteria bacterium]